MGGLLLALLMLGGNVTEWFVAKFQTGVTAQWWTWLVTTEPDWVKAPSKNVNLPFLVAFFTCIGLNGSWSLVKKGSGWLLVFLAISTVLAVVQNLVGVPLAKMMGESPLLGLVCGSLTLMGGVGTALGFAPELEKGRPLRRGRGERGGGNLWVGRGRFAGRAVGRLAHSKE